MHACLFMCSCVCVMNVKEFGEPGSIPKIRLFYSFYVVFL